MSKIKSIKAREIIDSRGNPTIEAVCAFLSGVEARASVPSGVSKGIREAVELRDSDSKRYNGLGVLRAVNNINLEINQRFQGGEFDQRTFDRKIIELDGTADKSRLGANAILGVSLAFARAKAKEEGVELYQYVGSLVGNRDFKIPQPMFNVINGGKHADSGLDIQEFMIVPIGFDSIKEKIRSASEIISALKKIIAEKGYATGLGDEGGFAPKLSSNEQAFELIIQAIKNSGYSSEGVKIGIDAAASGFYDGGSYEFKLSGQTKNLNGSDLIDWYEQMTVAYPIVSVEDGLAEDDWEGFSRMVEKLGNKIKIVGDDLTVTNVEMIQKAVEKKAVNSVLIKPNQIGTLTETAEAVELAQKNNYTPFVSHRSGETIDTFIADLAVGLSCDFIKAGSLARGERVSKYNRLMEIEDIV